MTNKHVFSEPFLFLPFFTDIKMQYSIELMAPAA